MKTNEQIAAEIVAYAKIEVEQALQKTTNFASRFKEDPYLALCDCKYTAKNAALASAWQQIAMAATPERPLSRLVEIAEHGIKTPYLHPSTDPVLGAMRLDLGAAWVQVREYLRDLEDYRIAS